MSAPGLLPDESLADDVRAFLIRCGAGKAADARLPVLARLYEDLVAANRQTNLTRLTDAAEFWLRHVADSLALGVALPAVMSNSLKLADVGCGAGFPSLPLAWANPQLDVTAVDARGRKVAFVAEEAEKLGLIKCRAISGQVRELAALPEHAGAYDVVTLRAVGTAGKFVKQCRRLLKPGGCLVFYKAPPSVAEERAEAQREARKFGMDLDITPPVELPAGAGTRQFCLFRTRVS